MASTHTASKTRRLPVVVRQADGIAVGVDLPFALEDHRIGLGEIRLVVYARRRDVEGVGVGIDIDEFQLAADNPRDHPLQLRVLTAQLHVGPHLSSRIAQPHRRNIARVDVRVGISRGVLAVVYRGHEVERVRAGGLHGLRLGHYLLERDDLVRAEDLVRCRERAELAVVRARRRVKADVRVDLRLAAAQLRGERTARLLDGERLGREVLHRQQGHDLLLAEQASVERLVDDADDLGVHGSASPLRP